ncbi:amino acid permease [Rhodococcus sp. ACS1]|uniref:APC family permease n=1 Tax=Rhodococcus sp. ACS1 TaxID=2028570 RepID=UPI000BB15F74|nr:APC family permease [Rhodococcus sp. ACS1]PBC39131.1 amino acid permease [Rhodococcus sp. ACS1]
MIGHRGVASSQTVRPRGDGKRELSVATGLAGLSLDAMASVSYGPEAIVLVLAVAGGAGLGFALPVTLAIAALLAVLVASYRQVIAAFPGGGGAYAVARTRLGRRSSLTAAASLIVDYVLNVAVSIAAGVAALTSAFPALLPYTVWIALVILAGITALNLRGIADSARAFMIPTVVFVAGIFTVIVAGLLRSEPASTVGGGVVPGHAQTIGILLLLKAFSSGCAALTGVEAIANAVPSFKTPRVVNAQRAEVALGVLLGTMLIGLAVLIEKFSLAPVLGTTVLSQLTAASLGDGVGYYVVQFATVVLLALAANTSYGGLPTLMRILADDNVLPHRFARKSSREVYRYGVLTLGIAAGVLLIGSGGNMNALVPLFAIGVFVGFTLAQIGMVRHWCAERTPGWTWRAALNGTGALLTAVAALVTAAMKFTEGAWLIVIALPLLVAGMERVRTAYEHIGERLTLGPDRMDPRVIGSPTTVLVPVSGVTELSRMALSAAVTMTPAPVAIRVCHPGESTTEFTRQWQARYPYTELILIEDTDNSVGVSLARYVRTHFTPRVSVILATIEPAVTWHRLLPTQRADEIARALRKHSDAMVCQIALRIDPAHRDPSLRA